MTLVTLSRQSWGNSRGRYSGSDGDQRQQQDAEDEGDEVEAQGEEALLHRMSELVLAVGDGDCLDERRHRRRAGPEADDQADRHDIGTAAAEDRLHGVADQVVGDLGVEQLMQEPVDLILDGGDRVRSEEWRDQPDETEQGQQDRRGGQRAPERGLRAEAEQRIAPGLAHRPAGHPAPALLPGRRQVAGHELVPGQRPEIAGMRHRIVGQRLVDLLAGLGAGQIGAEGQLLGARQHTVVVRVGQLEHLVLELLLLGHRPSRDRGPRHDPGGRLRVAAGCGVPLVERRQIGPGAVGRSAHTSRMPRSRARRANGRRRHAESVHSCAVSPPLGPDPLDTGGRMPGPRLGLPIEVCGSTVRTGWPGGWWQCPQ